jgi:hypothetical protein
MANILIVDDSDTVRTQLKNDLVKVQYGALGPWVLTKIGSIEP